MKITISTDALKRVLKDASRVAERRTTIPVLSHVLLECEPQGIRLSVTDLEISRQQFTPYASPIRAEDFEPWARAVPLKSLEALLPTTAKRVKASPVVILTPSESDDSEVRDDAIFVSIGGASTMLRTLPTEDFPVLPFAPPRYTDKRPTGKTVSELLDPAVIPGKGFRETVKKIFSAISTEESRFQLSGAFFELNGKLRMGATDGHRLNRSETDYLVGPELDLLPESELAFMVPRKALDCLRQDSAFGTTKRRVKDGVLKSGPRKGEDKFRNVTTWPDVYLSATDVHVFFEAPGVRYVARILEGEYPDIERVIKKEEPSLTVTTDAETLRATMLSIAHMTGDRARAIRMELGGKLPVFSAANPDKGTSTAEMNGNTKMAGRLKWNRRKKATKAAREKMTPYEIECLKATEATPDERVESLGINPDYILAAVSELQPDDEVSLCFYSATDQMLIKIADASEIRVIMPIRL